MCNSIICIFWSTVEMLHKLPNFDEDHCSTLPLIGVSSKEN